MSGIQWGQRLKIVPVACNAGAHAPSFDEYDYWLIWYFSSRQIERYEAVCGGDLDMETGQLESPNFPEDYQVFFWWLSGGEYDDDDDYGYGVDDDGDDDGDDDDDDDDDDDGVDDGDEPAWVAKLSR